MSKTAVQLAHGLPTGLTDLSLPELESLAKELNAVIALKRKVSEKSGGGELLLQLNTTILKPEERSRYWVLAEKLEADNLTEVEHQEFMKLADKDEKLRNKRLMLLIELAQQRNVPLPKLMEDLGITPVFNG